MPIEVIIPAYNEEQHLAAVIAAARSCPLVERVVVVDDGSTDRTAATARSAGAHVISLSRNQGKTAAIIAGVTATKAEVLMLLDADLIGLTPAHVHDLAQPVMNGEAGMTIGYFSHGRFLTDLSQRLTPFLNGQRALVREVTWILQKGEHLGYAVDTLLSRYAKRIGYPVRMVPLHGLTHVMKEEKIGSPKAVLSRISMYAQVIRAWMLRLPRKPYKSAGVRLERD